MRAASEFNRNDAKRDRILGVAMSRPIGIDLFAGAGGLSLGFEQAGFDVVAAVEIDSIHAAVHKYNFPDCVVLPRSIVGLSGNAIREAAKIGDRRVDVVFGGPPCQGFSLIGQRTFDDPRNGLVREFVRIVREIEPRYFLFENVKGLTIGKHRKFLEELIEEFGVNGYNLAAPWRVLNAVDYGVPQDRERLFLLGTRQGERLAKYPDATHRRGEPNGKSLPKTPTCAEALSDLPDADGFPTLLQTDEVKTNDWGKPSEYARRLRCMDQDGWENGYRRAWDPAFLTSSTRTIHTEISKRRFAETTPGSLEPISRFFKLAAGGVSNTLRAGTDAARGAFTSPRPIHYAHARCITVREMARLHGFPDWFRFHMTKWHGARQIGNSVPPPMGRAIAAEFLKSLGLKPSRPKREFNLAEPKLLRMGMAEASEYWGVDVPISKRDRKSGARKRKQGQFEMWEMLREYA
jgi:DNA (cytosine-5)-methyltransferase 1